MPIPNALAGLLGFGDEPPNQLQAAAPQITPTRGLLSGVLPWVFTNGDRAKRQLSGLLSDPVGNVQETLGMLGDSARNQNALMNAAFADPKNPLQITNQNALAQAAGNMLTGPLGFAPVGMTGWRGKPLTYDEALALVGGKTEKVGGVDPRMFLDAADGNGKSMAYGRVPLSGVAPNEAGALYDGTVNAARAAEYARRPPENAPPVLLIQGRRSGLFNVIDGGHRVSAARMRGDEDIPAIVMMRGQ